MCKCKGELIEYVGSKLTFNNSNGLGVIKFTQPVLICELVEKFKSADGPVFKTPSVARQVLRGNSNGMAAHDVMALYWSATSTCMLMM